MDTACNRCRSTKYIQNIYHNTWSVSNKCQENKMWTWIVRLMTGIGGVICEQRSVTLDQTNDGYNSDLFELCLPFKEGW